MKELTFKLSINEANLVLQSLSKQPYESVVSVIAKIQQQAQDQLPSPPNLDSKTD